jgi:hypothetical protein
MLSSSRTGLFGRVFDWQGRALTEDFRLSSQLAEITNPAVAALADGTFVTVWTSLAGLLGNDGEILGVRFDDAGQLLGAEFQVNTITAGVQERAEVASSLDGGFFVVWDSVSSSGEECDIVGRPYSLAGGATSDQFQINTYTTANQRFAHVERDSSGRFVVAWTSVSQDGSGAGTFARSFSPNAEPISVEFQVNSYTTLNQQRVRVAPKDDGTAVFVWDGEGVGDYHGIFSRSIGIDGGPGGTEFSVPTQTYYLQNDADVARADSGEFVVVWSSVDGTLNGYEEANVHARTLGASGVPFGEQFRLNSNRTSPSADAFPELSGTPDGRFVVTWLTDHLGSDENGERGFDIFHRRLFLDPTCGDANADRTVGATDALFALQKAVGQVTCDECLCDLDGSGTVVATDALRLLNLAVGTPVTTSCPACETGAIVSAAVPEPVAFRVEKRPEIE